jgi:hypothetical protein
MTLIPAVMRSQVRGIAAPASDKPLGLQGFCLFSNADIDIPLRSGSFLLPLPEKHGDFVMNGLTSLWKRGDASSA